MSEDLAVLNGAAIFVTVAKESSGRTTVRLELPRDGQAANTALAPAPDGQPNHYCAEDYDTLVDSPILAGKLAIHEFEVDGSKHELVDAGRHRKQLGWQARCTSLEKIVQETIAFLGIASVQESTSSSTSSAAGGGGLEHKNSTLLTSSPAGAAQPRSYLSWLDFVSHEYFHAFNVKRLRPVELGPFDYEHPPQTASLWISEGLTSYFGELIVSRAGLGTTDDFLASLSTHIGQLQNAPGRLVQTLEQSSLDVWTSGNSGLGRDNTDQSELLCQRSDRGVPARRQDPTGDGWQEEPR